MQVQLKKNIIDEYLEKQEDRRSAQEAQFFLTSYENEIKSVPEQLLACAWIINTITKNSGYLFLHPQQSVGSYRLDFALYPTDHFAPEHHPYTFSNETLDVLSTHSRRIAIEVDGFAFHDTTPEQHEYERTRQRFIQSQGWVVVRFAAREILRDPDVIAIELGLIFKKEVQLLYDFMSNKLRN